MQKTSIASTGASVRNSVPKHFPTIASKTKFFLMRKHTTASRRRLWHNSVCSVSAVYHRQLAFFNIPSQEIWFPFIPNLLSFLDLCRRYGGIWARHREARGCPVTPWRRRQTAPPIWLLGDGQNPCPYILIWARADRTRRGQVLETQIDFRNFWSHGPQNRCIWSKISRGK